MHTRRLLAFLPLLLALAPLQGAAPAADSSLARDFRDPPQSAKPWVYWFWLNGNISTQGITADLEAMKRVGIGGALIMEVDQGAPVGPVGFMSDTWRALFQHVHREARRLGLEINLNNDAGWNGSGGPWIRPEQSMQKVVFAETNVTGPSHFEVVMPKPEVLAGYYQDICVLAFPAVGGYRIPQIKTKAGYEIGYTGPAAETNLPPEMVIERNRIMDISRQLDPNGHLAWDAPAGEWTVLRIGHTCTGVENAPAPKSGRGLECDKLSREGIEANFAGMMAKLAADTAPQNRPGARGGPPGGLVATHIDSWENGSQNWTPRMREEFKARRGYDLWQYLPVLSGRVVDREEISERFLWDLRRTISELVVENYAQRMRQLAHERGLRFTVEAYGSPCDVIPYGGEADETMGEFWSPSGAMETCKGMASVGHVYGKTIIGAEAFTAGDQERWREHPASLKALGDHAFCEGINRFVVHRYALQAWPSTVTNREVRPGMMMGPWGQHYERTETWWEQSAAWHRYLARCQFLLRQGHFVADICYLQAETPPHGVGEHRRAGYDWDECSAEVVRTRMSVANGRITLPDGMSYRMLVLPDTGAMTPALLRKICELVGAGATVVGSPPRKSPSLSGYPECDNEVKRLAAELWGRPENEGEHRYGQGRVLRSNDPEKALRNLGVPADFTSAAKLRHIHRATRDTDIYFVANPAPVAVTTTGTFRVGDRVPELWWPESGRIERAGMFACTNGLTTVVLPLPPSGSVFVVFRKRLSREDHPTRLSRNDQEIISAVSRRLPIAVTKAVYGIPSEPQHTRDVREQVQRLVDTGEISFPVRLLIADGDPAPNEVKTLVVDYTIGDHSFSVTAQDPQNIYLTADAIQAKVLKATYGVLADPSRTRDVRDKLQRLLDAGETSFAVARLAQGDDPALDVVKTLEAECDIGGRKIALRGTDPEVIDLKPAAAPAEPVGDVRVSPQGRVFLEVWQPGEYELQTASGRTRRFEVTDVPPAIPVTGSWRVQFAPNWGAPPEIQLARLASWSEHSDPGVKYFSGAATYYKTVEIPRNLLGNGKRLFLDLGKVEVMAELKLNGRDLGTLWTPPFMVDVTGAAKAGPNRLEVRVVNLWPNRLIGDEQLPEDSDRNPNGTLKSWPAWLLEGKPSPTGRLTFSMWRLWKKDDALLPSGLLGPVTLRVAKEIPD